MAELGAPPFATAALVGGGGGVKGARDWQTSGRADAVWAPAGPSPPVWLAPRKI